MINISEQKIKETQLLQLRTEWREKEMKDEKEREIVFLDIQRQLDELSHHAKNRKEKATAILHFAKENQISFESLKY